MTKKEFQRDGLSWNELAEKGELAAVLDPLGSQRKNYYIHTIHVQMLSKALRRVHKGRILDFGCGTGRISRWLASHGWDVAGIDISPGMLTKAKELTPSSAPVSFLEYDGLHIPYDDEQFDAVVTVYVLQYPIKYPDSLVLIANELHRVLKPGGRLSCIEITDKQQLSVGNYTDQITSAGFTLVHDEPVRLRFDRYMNYAQRRFIPMSFIPVLGRLGIWECRRKYMQGRMPPNWWDHLYIFERK